MRKFVKFIFVVIIGFNTFFTNAQELKSKEPIQNIQEFCSGLKGFNLLGHFDVNWSNNGYKEKEFQVMQELGFTFARLPADYRTYTLTNNWNYFVESRLKNYDDAIAWAEKYNIHVSLNLHRAPGYCVNETTNLPVEQQRDLWTDTIAQNVFVNHWKFFANRYKDVSPQVLSFNLVNEPKNLEEAVYVNVMKKAIDAIHEVSPNRLVFVDGLNYARDVVLSLKDQPNVAQALHSYDPFRLTHYKAGWVNGSDTWPVPKWPIYSINNYLYGTWKSEFKSPLVFLGTFLKGTEIIINVNQVSIEGTLQVKADNSVVYNKRFVCGATPGDDFTEVKETQWGYQNISNKDFSMVLPDSVSKISIENVAGDWMTINSISFKNGNDSITYTLDDSSWGKKQSTYLIDENWGVKNEDGSQMSAFEDYETSFALAKQNNIPFMVQEFGVYNKTPHKVTLAFLSDLMDFFNEKNVGWSLWNLDGTFGILNSGRADVNYEAFNGYQLDRQMLNILLPKPTSSQTFMKNEKVEVFPNPANNEVFIKSKDFEGETILKIIDIQGKEIKNEKFFMEQNTAKKVNVSNLKPGLYFINLQHQQNQFYSKLFINKTD